MCFQIRRSGCISVGTLKTALTYNPFARFVQLTRFSRCFFVIYRFILIINVCVHVHIRGGCVSAVCLCKSAILSHLSAQCCMVMSRFLTTRIYAGQSSLLIEYNVIFSLLQVRTQCYVRGHGATLKFTKTEQKRYTLQRNPKLF